MTGRLDRNLRQGHKAEKLGVELLCQLCAVASVPQSEDVGFDAVATLLRRDNRFLYAEESFCVQFKARLVREIAYQAHKYKWFRALTLPFFIGSVDLATGETALFTTHNLATRPDGQSFASAVIYLDPNQTRLEGEVVHQSLGPPILQWTTTQGEDPAFQTLAYEVLKKWITLEYVNLTLRTIRTKRDVRWKTNEVPAAGYMSIMSHPSELDEDIEATVPYLNKLAMHFMDFDEEVSYPSLGLYLLMQWLRERGTSESELFVRVMEERIRNRYDKIDFQLKVEKT